MGLNLSKQDNAYIPINVNNDVKYFMNDIGFQIARNSTWC